MSIDDIINKTLSAEGGYVNNSLDRGGETNWGITILTARSNGYKGSMRDLTKEDAIKIYKSEYYFKPNFDKVFEISPAVADELFDTGVNLGITTASKFLQQALNILNKNQKLYADIKADGFIGTNTLKTLQLYMKSRQNAERILLKVLNGLQFMRYYNITEKNSSQEEFIAGWVDNRL